MASAPPLGLPQHVGYAVADAEAAARELSAGTGTGFTAVERSRVRVALPGRGPVDVTLRSTRSTGPGPTVELVDASPAVGPWETGRFSTPHLSYAVDDLRASGDRLAAAGLRLVATSPDFAVWEGLHGLLVRLVKAPSARTARATGERAAGTSRGRDAGKAPGRASRTDRRITATPAAGMNLGPSMAFVFTPCDPVPFTAQLTAALGVDWRAPMTFHLPWQFADGSWPDITEETYISMAGPPFLVTETPHHAPAEYGCTTHRHLRLIFLNDAVADAEAQLTAAGIPWIARVDGLITEALTDSGIFLEVAHSSFLGSIG